MPRSCSPNAQSRIPTSDEQWEKTRARTAWSSPSFFEGPAAYLVQSFHEMLNWACWKTHCRSCSRRPCKRYRLSVSLRYSPIGQFRLNIRQSMRLVGRHDRRATCYRRKSIAPKGKGREEQASKQDLRRMDLPDIIRLGQTRKLEDRFGHHVRPEKGRYRKQPTSDGSISQYQLNDRTS